MKTSLCAIVAFISNIYIARTDAAAVLTLAHYDSPMETDDDGYTYICVNFSDLKATITVVTKEESSITVVPDRAFVDDIEYTIRKTCNVIRVATSQLRELGCCNDMKTSTTDPVCKGCDDVISRENSFPTLQTIDVLTLGQDEETTTISNTAETSSEEFGGDASCQSSIFGCCPDGETPAHGPEFQGCCLQHVFGCCPDNYNLAKGPHLEGCGCENAHFGCCPDNKTIARGANNKGCDCKYTEHGCCPDRYTPASGPEFTGCDCNSYEFGCCPDGVAAATGPRLQGCSCQESIYGCCGDGVTAAAGPNKEGCDCSSSKYGCCPDGKTEAAGEKFLNCTDLPKDPCTLPIESGSCAGHFPRWGYERATQSCSQFIWGGCEGNSNRFNSEAACIHRCNPPGVLQANCYLPQDEGHCTEKYPMWSFSQTENRCIPFYYTGCGGNGNRYKTEQACATACPSLSTGNICAQPPTTGVCSNFNERWYYNSQSKRCSKFKNCGLDGNGNNFETEQACESRCSNTIESILVQPIKRLPYFCHMEVDSGLDSAWEDRWAFFSTNGTCQKFKYGGSGGNRNNFLSENICLKFCSPGQDLCNLPIMPVPCNDSIYDWAYNPVNDSCSQLGDGTCGGNENRFKSLKDCERRCKKRTEAVVQYSRFVARICKVSPDLEACDRAGQVWYYNVTEEACVSFENSATGNSCRVTAVFSSEEQCERECGTFQELNVCRFPKNPGPCHESIPKFYYNAQHDRCEEFTYGGCYGGPNRFSSIEECEYMCKPHTDRCRQRPEVGECVQDSIQWYYDEQSKACKEFLYGGCDDGGIANRFTTELECENYCINQKRFTWASKV